MVQSKKAGLKFGLELNCFFKTGVNRIFPLRLLTAGAISLFLNITGAIAPVAPVLNTPLLRSATQAHRT